MSDTLRLDRLEITNYRCFSRCELALHPRLTVLVAENGQGKTALLDAITLALGPLVNELSQLRQWKGIVPEDVRRVPGDGLEMLAALPTELRVQGVLDGKRLQWAVARASEVPRGKTTTRDLKALRATAAGLRGRLDSYASRARAIPPPLPLIAAYGTKRLWGETPLTERRRRRDTSALARVAGYLDCLSSAASPRVLSAWYEGVANAARAPTVVAADPREHPVKLLSAVRKAVRVVLEPTGWREIDWEYAERDPETKLVRRPGVLVVEHPTHGRLPLSMLSDGVRNMIALVADIARRCVLLNPQLGEQAVDYTPGVLLVDEVDMHLHPGWQQEVIGLLQRAFPHLQLVVTTHSPQVLTTVDRESIRVVQVSDGEGGLRQPDHQTRGVESADVLARVMGVHAVPRVEEAGWLSRYRALVQAGADRSVEAKALWLKLADHFGEDHPVMHEVATLRSFQEFKRAHGLAQEGA